MKAAIDEMSRRRQIQLEYNKTNNITPESIKKSIEQIMEYEEANHSCTTLSEEEEIYETGVSVIQLIVKLEKQMLGAAKNLEFEKAAGLRDRIKKLRAQDLNIIAG